MQSKFKIKVRTLKDEAIVCFPLENYHDQYLFASLPAWERGLKRFDLALYALERWSLPAWERGLKPLDHALSALERWPLPAWVRR